MKAKLIKTELEDYHMGHYFLNDTNCYAIGSTDFGWCKTSAGIPKYKLSKQNCDEIFGVVDVEKLADEELLKAEKHHKLLSPITYKDGIKKGFNKAMELQKDKLFTADDMLKATVEIWNTCKDNKHDETFTQCFNKTLKSLQQPTEIEVEVVMSEIVTDDFVGMQGIPKLDNNGCLILKKI